MPIPGTEKLNGSQLTEISLDLSQIDAVKQQFANGAPYWSRISFAMCARLLFDKDSSDSGDYVREEIEVLEGLRSPGNTKPAQPFKRPPLKGFFHKHFSTPRHTLRNIGERWGLSGQGNADLNREISSVASQYGDKPGIWPGVLAHKVVIGGLLDRSEARRMTGDWIIFAKNGSSENIYLDVATHQEGRTPEQLLIKLFQGCAWEFPEFFPENSASNS